jgi:hypothetical protein
MKIQLFVPQIYDFSTMVEGNATMKPSETITLSQITPDWMKRLKAVLEPHLQQERHQKVQKRKLRGPRL